MFTFQLCDFGSDGVSFLKMTPKIKKQKSKTKDFDM